MATNRSSSVEAGYSPNLEKLKRLCLPSLYGKTFLDVSCNEGFFCGYARFDGAARAIGLDQAAPFLARARRRFPECEFLKQSWDELPEASFDVILLASALHYANDQPDLIERLMERLAPGGTLVLELGVASKPGNEWVNVTRGMETRPFPTWGKLEEILKSYTWRHIGPSVTQRVEDPVTRHVLHVRRRLPFAYLMMQPPAYGKRSVCRSLFNQAGVTVISGDQILEAIATGKLVAPADITEAIRHAPLGIDQTVHHLFETKLGERLVRLWVERAGGNDFALDACVPADHQAEVSRLIGLEGYMPVSMVLDQAEGPLPVAHLSAARADAYHLSQPQQAEEKPQSGKPLPLKVAKGCVDVVRVENEKLIVRGWAVNESGSLPALLRIDLGGQVFDIATFESHLRPDVQKLLGLTHALCGYRITTIVPGVNNLVNAIPNIRVYGGDDASQLHGPFQVAKTVTRASP